MRPASAPGAVSAAAATRRTGAPAAPTAPRPAAATSLGADPLRPRRRSRPPKSGPDPFSYFVQAGAFARAEDAEQQRARLALLGVAAKVTEREQAGRTVYRVRLGPYEKKDDADVARAKLESGGVEAALVRVQK